MPMSVRKHSLGSTKVSGPLNCYIFKLGKQETLTKLNFQHKLYFQECLCVPRESHNIFYKIQVTNSGNLVLWKYITNLKRAKVRRDKQIMLVN